MDGVLKIAPTTKTLAWSAPVLATLVTVLKTVTLTMASLRIYPMDSKFAVNVVTIAKHVMETLKTAQPVHQITSSTRQGVQMELITVPRVASMGTLQTVSQENVCRVTRPATIAK